VFDRTQNAISGGRIKYTFQRGAAAQYLDDFLTNAWSDNEENETRYREEGKIVSDVTAGRMGLVPEHAEVGDEVTVLLSTHTLTALRRLAIIVDDGTARFQLIGECCVHGLMDGEALKQVEDGTLYLHDLAIV
jgi:hypothetical protein